MNTQSKDLDIKRILEEENLKIKFQPIVSVINKSVIGLESFAEGAKNNDNSIIPVNNLIKTAKTNDLSIQLDRLYRENSVDDFFKLYKSNKDMLLFININISVIDKYIGSGIILNLVKKYDIEPNNVVLEIVDDKIDDIESMQKFIKFYRSRGFLIAIKNLGTGFANLDRIYYVEPDIIKINKAITENIESDYYRQEIFKSLVNLSKQIGALIIAEDIESEYAAMLVMEFGADMLQGNFFKERDHIENINLEELKIKVSNNATNYKNYMAEEISSKESIFKDYDKILNNILKELSKTNQDCYDDVLSSVIDKYNDLECVYILDNDGKQISSTATKYNNILSQKALIFQPAKKGTDHSLKKYYYYLNNMHLDKYVTDSYISMATGNLCITVSQKFNTVDNTNCILCIDFNPNYMSM